MRPKETITEHPGLGCGAVGAGKRSMGSKINFSSLAVLPKVLVEATWMPSKSSHLLPSKVWSIMEDYMRKRMCVCVCVCVYVHVCVCVCVCVCMTGSAIQQKLTQFL